MKDNRHIEVRNLFSFLDDPFSMSSSQLKERILLSANPRPHWFWKTIVEREISWRDFIGSALQHIMECKDFIPFSHLDLHGFKEEKIDDGGHLRMDNISHVCVGHFLSPTHHDGRFLPTTYLDPYGVKLILEKISFQIPMKCKDKNLIWEDGGPC